MALSRTAQYYRDNPEANKRRLKQQKDYDEGRGSTGRSKKEIQGYRNNLNKWKRKNKKSKPKGKIVEAVHGKDGRIRWQKGESARKHNRGNEVRRRNKPSNPKGGGKRRRVRLTSKIA